MTLKELQALKYKAEADIRNTMSDFEKTTGLVISEISSERTEVTYSGDAKPAISFITVSLEVKL